MNSFITVKISIDNGQLYEEHNNDRAYPNNRKNICNRRKYDR